MQNNSSLQYAAFLSSGSTLTLAHDATTFRYNTERMEHCCCFLQWSMALLWLGGSQQSRRGSEECETNSASVDNHIIIYDDSTLCTRKHILLLCSHYTRGM